MPLWPIRRRELLARMGYANVEVIAGDGSQGVGEHAPYDAIIVSAAALELPPVLVTQLAEGGRMIFQWELRIRSNCS